MSYILAVVMGTLAIAGMYQHSDWRYWMSAWAVCALFIFVGHVGSILAYWREEKKAIIDRILKTPFKKGDDNESQV